MLNSKVPGSSNPAAPWQDMGTTAESPRATDHPKMDYAMGNPGQATSPVETISVIPNEPTSAAIQVVQGVENTATNANRG